MIFGKRLVGTPFVSNGRSTFYVERARHYH